MLGGGVRALFVMEANPAAVAGDGRGAAAARLPGRAGSVPDRDGASWPTWCCPQRSFAEADGTYTNLERRVQRGPDGIDSIGESLPDWADPDRAGRSAGSAAQTTAHRAGSGRQLCPTGSARSARTAAKGAPAPSRGTTRHAQAVLEEIGKAVPAYAGMRWETLGEQGLQWPASALARAGPRVSSRSTSRPLPRRPRAASCWSAARCCGTAARSCSTPPPRCATGIPAPFVALNPADLAAVRLAEGQQRDRHLAARQRQRCRCAPTPPCSRAQPGFRSGLTGPARRDARRRPRRAGVVARSPAVTA